MKSTTAKVFLLLFVLPVLFFSPYLFRSPQPLILPNSTFGTDLLRETLPTSSFIQQELNRWQSVPLWRPYIISGAPLVGHPVYPLFYPPYWIIMVLPVPLALNLLVVLHLGWAASGTFLFLRKVYRLSTPAALAGAIIFGFSPRFIAYVSGGHWTMMMAIAWLPWVWLSFFRSLKTGRWTWILLLGACVGAQVLIDLRTTFITLLPLIFVTVVTLKKPLAHSLLQALKIWGVSGVLALGLSAAQLLPFLELLTETTRTALSFQEASGGSLHPALLIGLLYPISVPMPEFYIYIGAGGLLLSCISIFGRSLKETRLLLSLLLLILLICLGSYTPLYALLYTLFPGFSFLRAPARWWIDAVFLFSILAAFGVDVLLDRGAEIQKKKSMLLVVLGALYLGGLLLSIFFPGQLPFNPLPAFIDFAGVSLLLVGRFRPWKAYAILPILLLGLWIPSKALLLPVSQSDNQAENSRIITTLMSGALEGSRSLAPFGYGDLPDAFHSNLLAADGYNSFHLRSYRNLVEKLIGCDGAGYSASIPAIQSSPAALAACPSIQLNQNLAKLLNIRYLLLPQAQAVNTGQQIASESGLILYDLGTGNGPAFGVDRIKVVPSDRCLDALDQVDLQRTALLEESLPIPQNTAQVKILDWKTLANGVEFSVQAGQSGFLVRSETWAPGWKAADEHGKPLKVYRADCALQGVLVGAGVHTIRFEYRPDLLIAGIAISLIFALAAVLLFAILVVKRR